MKVEKILDGFVEYSDFLDNVLIGKTKDGYLTFIQKDDYTIIDKNMLNDKIVKIRKLTGSNFVECKDVNGYFTLRRSSHPFSIPTRTMDNKKIVSISSIPGKHYMVAKSENGDIYLIDSLYGRIFDMLPIAKSIKDVNMDFYSIIYPISPKLLLIGNEKDKLNLFEIVDNKMIKRIFKKDTYIKIQDIDLREDGTVFVIADGSTYRLS